MGDVRATRPVRGGLTRRDFLHLGAGVAVAAVVPSTVAAAPPGGGNPGPGTPSALDDPYRGAIPLVFPVADGTYRKPVRDNWHDNREGDYGYSWSHENSSTQRAHDGLDIFPRFAGSLPTVYAPFAARVVDVNIDQYRRATDAPLLPPWDYGRDNIYGNYLWLYSIDTRSTGFFMFYCHLQDERLLRGLADRLATNAALGVSTAVGVSTPVGVMGESGNAPGDPQLHLELHRPKDTAFLCERCVSPKAGMTAINPYPSLNNATRR